MQRASEREFESGRPFAGLLERYASATLKRVSEPPTEPVPPPSLPPTTEKLLDPAAFPYFLWWNQCTVSDFRARLESTDDRVRGYWLGALLREANSRDVWLFTTPDLIRKDWELVLPHLGKARAMWGWLLDMDATWPPNRHA